MVLSERCIAIMNALLGKPVFIVEESHLDPNTLTFYGSSAASNMIYNILLLTTIFMAMLTKRKYGSN